MEVSKLAHRGRQDHQRGVALLISLSVILLLSIALMKNFEKRSIEVAHLGNNLERFQAESLSRSVFKVILISIKEQGLIALLGNRSYWQGIDFSLGNGFFRIQEVTPIDHRFNLNQRIGDGVAPRVTVFKNMVRINRKLLGGYDDPSGENENEALSAINDWVDRDQDMDKVFLYDAEQYYREEPSFSVKNREFDRLSEVRLLPAFRVLGITAEYLENNFRVLGEYDEYIDINLNREKEIKDFLNRYENVAGYPNVFERQNEIWKLIEEQQISESPNLLSGPSEVKTPFPAKDFGRIWKDALIAAGVNLEDKELSLFKPNSKNLFIRFRVQVGKATVNIRSTVRVKYLKPEKNLDIGELTILSFRII
ncbi:MAG: hypothetical protein HOE30_06210 [Deltaproteobacteria bacterium]|jgi:type II secretory pathway component PulK|nr:hypothetical protein [Deltaproteobacteria bacterium]MBT4088067.1 hypothetical protein [Deltaproteobacteria bacterium]MBT4269257.1 hypothetical protein [Deltaproteobacteria bacterium]MBT4639228.1 hypothetical protein [Deltaproteobacteria bacterium]MBT6500114.1 hypothetical protein [Deltaproteobacteria bacterium]